MEKENKKSRKGIFVAAIGMGIALTGAAVASAVSLGIEANHDLAAGTSVTASCQPAGASNDIAVGFSTPTYVAASQTFTVNEVVLSNVLPACNGLEYQVVVADSAGASLGTVNGTVGGATVNAALSGAVDTDDVASVSVVIYDN